MPAFNSNPALSAWDDIFKGLLNNYLTEVIE